MTGIEGLRVSVPRRLFVISLQMCPLRKMLCNIRHMWESFQKDHHILNTICMILYVAVVGVCRCEERQWVEGMILVVQIVELDLLLLRAVVLGTALTSAWFCRKDWLWWPGYTTNLCCFWNVCCWFRTQSCFTPEDTSRLEEVFLHGYKDHLMPRFALH